MLIAGLRLIGIVAPMVLAGPINGRSFQTYVDRVLIPDLRLGDIVIMDNLGPHKGPDVQAAIEAAGATIRYLPPYSPNFNPIEKAFSKLKARLRKGVEHTHDALWDRISTLIDQLPPPQNATTSSQPQNMNQIKKRSRNYQRAIGVIRRKVFEPMMSVIRQAMEQCGYLKCRRKRSIRFLRRHLLFLMRASAPLKRLKRHPIHWLPYRLRSMHSVKQPDFIQSP